MPRPNSTSVLSFTVRMVVAVTLVSVSLAVFSGCAKNTRIAANEKAFFGWRSAKSLAVFHRVANRDQGLGLRFPGFLIGIEKADRSRIDFDNDLISLEPQDAISRTADSTSDRTCDPTSDRTWHADWRKKVWRMLDDQHRTFISHLVEYSSLPSETNWQRIHERIVYSAYDSQLAPQDAYRRGFRKLREFGATFQAHVSSAMLAPRPYTHLFIFAMGWNTDQQESIRNFNSLVSFLDQEKPEELTQFRPLVIGITWPSEWLWVVAPRLGRLMSYPVRSNDADEIGLIWANYILKEMLLPIKKRYNLPLIAVGHSFGARLLSTAINAGPLVVKDDKGGSEHIENPDLIVADLVVGLQGAMSVNRFVDGEGNEGTPYRSFCRYARKYVFSWSKFDRANPLAAFVTGAKHIGGIAGYSQAREYRDLFDLFVIRNRGNPPGFGPIEIEADNENGNNRSWCEAINEEGTIALVDASEVVRFEAYQKGGKAHNDVYTPSIARLIWKSIDALEPEGCGK